MKIFDGIRTGIRSLVSSWLRSLLSILGVVIGVGTLVVMISIGEGTKRQIVRNVEAMGSNLIVLKNDPVRGLRSRETRGLTVRDIELLKKHCHLAEAVAPLKMIPLKVSYGGKSLPSFGQGTTSDLLGIANLSVAKGRFLSPRDVEESAKVCVLGSKVQSPHRLDLPGDPVGQFITLNGLGFRIVGVLRTKGLVPHLNPDISVFIPISVCQEMSEDRADLANILIQGASSNLIDRTKNELSRLMTFFHRGNADFSLWAQDDLLEQLKKVTETLQKVLGAIALIALVIAGIGIMNVLLASVSERIREIGIRKALGANPLDVLMQFVWESLLLTVTGGTIGILLGVAAGDWICKVLTIHMPQAEHRWEAPISLESVLISFGFALVTGLFFGLYPAVKAARLDPCEALAYE